MQALDQLPPHLAISVLQSSNSLQLKSLLERLPVNHHSLALKAWFSSITSQNHLEISPVSLSNLTDQSRVLSQVFKAAETLTGLKSLNVGMFWVSHAFSYSPPDESMLCSAFLNTLQALTHLTKLDIGSDDPASTGLGFDSCFNSLLPSVAAKLGKILPKLGNLKELRLECRREMRYVGCQTLLEGLQGCTNLRKLTMQGVAIVSDTAANLPRRYPEQQFNWRRQAHTGRLTAAWRRGTAPVSPGQGTGSWAFGAALACMTSLESLTCSRVYLDQAALRPMKDVLLHTSPAMLNTLTELCLAGSTFNPPTHHRHRRTSPLAQHPASNWDIKDLTVVLRRTSNLERIDLSNCSLNSGRAKILAPAFRSLRKLTHIDLAGNFLGYNGVEFFAECWRNLQHVTRLDMAEAAGGWSHRFDPQSDVTSAQNIMASIKGFENLKHLNLTDFPVTCDNTDACAHALADCMSCHSSLEWLAVECGGWQSVSMHAFMHGISGHRRLKHLSLSDNMRRYPSAVNSTDAITAFGRSLWRNSSFKSLTHLSIKCVADSTATSTVASTFRDLSGLESLELSGLRIHDKVTALGLCHGLSHLSKLETLSLVRSGLNYKHAKPVAVELGKMTKLTYLALSIDFRGPDSDDVVLDDLGRPEDRETDAPDQAGLTPSSLAQELAALPVLDVLNLSGSVLSELGCVRIVGAFVQSGRQLKDCFLSSDDYAMVAKRTRRPEVLDLPWVRIRAHYDPR